MERRSSWEVIFPLSDSPNFMEPKGLWPSSQESATLPCPDHDESGPCTSVCFGLQSGLFVLLSLLKLVCISLLPLLFHMACLLCPLWFNQCNISYGDQIEVPHSAFFCILFLLPPFKTKMSFSALCCKIPLAYVPSIIWEVKFHTSIEVLPRLQLYFSYIKCETYEPESRVEIMLGYIFDKSIKHRLTEVARNSTKVCLKMFGLPCLESQGLTLSLPAI
jgi:hypothetical protein